MSFCTVEGRWYADVALKDAEHDTAHIRGINK